ncbi:hypothetical protein HanRHA438_Chr14g0682021 [Helianthus annuus]|nr:hypothetical protein HanRHA438_Chr14g0682021 [Helianthus annuus]
MVVDESLFGLGCEIGSHRRCRNRRKMTGSCDCGVTVSNGMIGCLFCFILMKSLRQRFNY